MLDIIINIIIIIIDDNIMDGIGLPLEIIYEIVKYLSDEVKQKVRYCSKLLYNVVNDIGYDRIDIDTEDKLFSFITAKEKGLNIRNSYLVINYSAIDNQYLKYFSNSRRIHLEYCSKIENDDIVYLSNISDISLWGCKNVTSDGFKYLKNVKKIRFHFHLCPNLEDYLHYIPNIVEIDLTGCIQLTDEHLKFLLKVENIILKNCINITGNGLKYLEEVRKIDLQGCNQIKDYDLAHLKDKNIISANLSYLKISYGLEYLPNIKYINLSFTDITDNDLEYIQNAEIAILVGCNNITNLGLHYLDNIKHINLNGCNNIIHTENRFIESWDSNLYSLDSYI